MANVWELMELHKNEFTTTDEEVYKLVQENPFVFQSETAASIASEYHVSQAAISRFCQKLGFHGFGDFRLSMMLSLNAKNDDEKDAPTEYTDYVSQMFQTIYKSLSTKESDEMIRHLLSYRTIFISGYGASDISADNLAFRLELMGVNAVHIPSSREIEYLHIMTNQDAVVLLSNYNPSHRDFFSMIDDIPEESRPFILLVSAIKKHPFAKKSDQIFVLPSIPEKHGKFVVESSSKQLFFTIILSQFVAAILNEKNQAVGNLSE